MQNKKKLVYILHDIEIGGVEVALLSAIPELSEKYILKIIVLGEVNQKLISHFTEDQKAVFQAFSYPIYLYPFYLTEIVKFIIDLKPDLLICSLWRALLVGQLVKKRYETVQFFSFIHSVSFFHYLSEKFSIKALKKSDVVLTDSDSSYHFIKNNISLTCPIRKVSFLTHHSPSYKERELNSSENTIRFMFLGRLDKVKNLPLVISVIEFLRNEGYHVNLDIYGRHDNAYEEALQAVKAKQLEQNVFFKGEIQPSKKFELFDGYDFYIQLSLVEGMAMSVAEAMQNGLPCIVTPVGEIPNYSSDMQSAIFIDIWDEDSWIPSLRKIEEVIKNKNLYHKISKTSWSNFQDKKIYVDSLIENLEMGLKNN